MARNLTGRLARLENQTPTEPPARVVIYDPHHPGEPEQTIETTRRRWLAAGCNGGVIVAIPDNQRLIEAQANENDQGKN